LSFSFEHLPRIVGSTSNDLPIPRVPHPCASFAQGWDSTEASSYILAFALLFAFAFAFAFAFGWRSASALR
jgi:hypothetical protein